MAGAVTPLDAAELKGLPHTCPFGVGRQYMYEVA